MRTEDVLAATRTGLWRWDWQWDEAAYTVSLDAVAAELLGLPPEPVTGPEDLVRARFHTVDYTELRDVVARAAAEGSVAEVLLRVVGKDSSVARVVRLRLVPAAPQGPGRASAPLVGLLSEAPEPPPSFPPDVYPSGAPRRAPQEAPAPDTAVQPSAAPSSVTGDWRRSREAFLLDAGRALAEAHSTEEVLEVTATLSMPGFTPNGLAVFGVEGDRLTVVGHRGQAPGSERSFLDMSLDTDYPAAEVVRTGRAVYLSSPEEYRERFPGTWPLAERFGRRSWAYLPLVSGGRTIGAWMAGFADPVAFTPDERSVLTTVARMLAQALSRTYTRESEQALADDLQRSMRPARRLDIPGMSVVGRYVPTGGGLQVGGDWYDVIPLPSGRTALVIGDVQGHDVRAAGIMGQLRTALRAYAAEGHHPDAVLSRASRFLAGMSQDVGSVGEQTEDMGRDWYESRFATCLYVEVDPVSGSLSVARAGHPDPATRLADGTLLVRPTAGGLPLGVDPDADYPTTHMMLEPDETLLLCTDGLIETGGHDMETGWARLREVLEKQPEAPLEKLADTLIQSVHGPPSHHRTGPLADRREDDIALLLLRRNAEGLGGMPPATVRRTILTVAQTEPARVADARHQLRELLYDWTSDDQVEGAVLLLSELLTNVLVHTDGDAMVLVGVTGDRGSRLLRVEVADSSDELPHRRHPGELASSGRGLLLMEMLADAWGVEPRGEGKCTWFELREAPVEHPAEGGRPAAEAPVPDRIEVP